MSRISIELGLGLAGIAVVGVFSVYQIGAFQKEMAVLNQAPASTAQNNTGNEPSAVLTTEIVAKHNVPSDCWIIISDKVYSVSGYLDSHPGGAREITPYCGKDATQAFVTKGGRGTHSSSAVDALGSLYVGSVSGNTPPSVAPENPIPPAAVAPTVVPTTAQQVSLAVADVAKHNTPADCWIIVAGNVYTVSNYLNSHPGGAREITPYCGKDATQGFASRGGTGSHSSFAQQELASLLLGPVGGATSGTTITNANQNAASSQSGGGGEYEDD